MEQIQKVILTLHQQYGPCPQGDDNWGNSFYAWKDGKIITVAMPSIDDGMITNLNSLQHSISNGHVVPIFNHRNLHSSRANWASSFYHDLLRITNTVIRLAASIFEIIVDERMKERRSAIPDLAIPSRLEISAGAKIFRRATHGLDQQTLALVNNIIEEEEIYDDVIPWVERSMYRRVGVRNRVVGARIDVSRRVDSNGDMIVDFRDVFAALVNVVDWMWCPAPKYFMNRTEDPRIVKEDPNYLTAGLGPLEIKFCEKLIITVPDACHDNIQPLVERVVGALVSAEIIQASDVTMIMACSLYIQTILPVTPMSIYVAAMLNPCVSYANFYYSENTRTVFGSQNDVLYYSSTPEDESSGKPFTSHVYIVRLDPKKGTFAEGFDFAPGEKMCTYTVTIEYSENAQILRFERDFIKMLRVMKRDLKYVGYFMNRIGQRVNSATVSPPLVGKFTRKYTYKTRNSSKHKPAEAKNRPIYVPPSYGPGDGYARAMRIAEIISFAIHQRLDRIYVSCEHKIILLSDIRNTRQGRVDEFSALYIPNVAYHPVENRVTNGTAVIPWVYVNRIGNSSTTINPSYSGITDTRQWSSFPPYARQLGKASLFGALKMAMKARVSTGAAAGAGVPLTETLAEMADRLVPGGLSTMYPMLKPELFDHTIPEIAKTFNDLDSAIHLRILEYLFKCTIFVMVPEKDPYAELGDNTPLVLESMRSACLQLRDVTGRSPVNQTYFDGGRIRSLANHDGDSGDGGDNWPLVVIVKFYSSGWKYLCVSRARLASEKVAWSNAKPEDEILITGDLRQEVIANVFKPHMLYNFDRKCLVVATEDRYFPVFEQNGLVPVSQTIDPDGYVIAMTFEGRRDAFMTAILILHNADPAQISRLDRAYASEIIQLTVSIRGKVAPYPIPMGGDYVRMSAQDFGFLEGLIDEKCRFVTPEKTPFFRIGTIIILRERPDNEALVATAVSPDILKYQRQMIVLLSLMHAFAVNMPHIEKDHVVHFHAAIINHSRLVPDGEAVVAKNRFIPDLVHGYRQQRHPASQQNLPDSVSRPSPNFISRASFGIGDSRASSRASSHTNIGRSVSSLGDTVIERFREVLAAYFPTFMKFDAAGAEALYKYIFAELFWIRTYRPPPSSIRYIDGILEFGANRAIFVYGDDHPLSDGRGPMAGFRAPRWGEASIVTDMKSYEYATIRFGAKRSMSSCVSFMDLTDNETSASHRYKSAFVKRRDDGTVVYGFAVSDAAYAEEILKVEITNYGFPTNYSLNWISGYDSLENMTFKSDTLAIFCTSKSDAQGSWYRLYIFVPGGRMMKTTPIIAE